MAGVVRQAEGKGKPGEPRAEKKRPDQLAAGAVNDVPMSATLQPHQISVAEQVRANLALLEVAQKDTVHTPRQQP